MESFSTDWQTRIAAARKGDRAAIGEIFRHLRGSLRLMAQKQLDLQLQVKVSPSDIVQETLLEAYRGLDTFHGATRGELVAWLHGILTHRVLTARRRYRGTSKRDIDCERPLHRADGAPPLMIASSNLSSPSKHAVSNEEQIRLEAALLELSPRQEQVIRLRNELKLSFAEIATVLDCTADASQKLWSRAISQLARKLNSHAPQRKQ